MSPLNRPNGVFELVAGIVDTDTYTAPVHLPFFATGEDGLYTLEQGSPLVQVIPFRRADTRLEAVIRAETAQESQIRTQIRRAASAGDGWYRKFARERR